jgi:hypothetical protein
MNNLTCVESVLFLGSPGELRFVYTYCCAVVLIVLCGVSCVCYGCFVNPVVSIPVDVIKVNILFCIDKYIIAVTHLGSMSFSIFNACV